jgi:flagellar hook-associated protein 3 FlgL
LQTIQKKMRADPTYIQSLSWSLNQATSTTNSLTSELSSGLRVSAPSDDPLAAAQSSQLATAISHADSFNQTSATETSLLQVTDSTLGEVVSQLTSAVSLSVSASNGTNNASNISAIVQQLTGIRDQIVSLANTTYQGRYLFSGSQGTTPFTLNTSTSPATVTYNGDTSLQYIQTPTGQSLQTNLPGSSVFGAAFTGLNQIIADLNSGTASASTLSTDSSALTSALSTVSTQRSLLDSSLSRLQSATNYHQTEEAQLKAQQSTLVAADPAAIATQLKSTETQYQALLSVMSALQKQSLFDYLR